MLCICDVVKKKKRKKEIHLSHSQAKFRMGSKMLTMFLSFCSYRPTSFLFSINIWFPRARGKGSAFSPKYNFECFINHLGVVFFVCFFFCFVLFCFVFFEGIYLMAAFMLWYPIHALPSSSPWARYKISELITMNIFHTFEHFDI